MNAPPRALLLLALLAAPGLGQTRVAVEVPLHPLIVGAVSDPGHPVAGALAAPLGRIAAGEAPRAVMQELAASGPLGRLSAGVLARTLSEPAAAGALAAARPALAGDLARARARLGPAAQELAAASGGADVASFFDGGKPGLELEGLEIRRGRLRLGGVKAARLGQGAFGVVDEHPAVEGAVVKTEELAFENILADPREVRRMLDADAPTARRLAEAGVGPRLFGVGAIGRRRVSVRERVYGDTLQRLIWDRRFEPDDERLVLEMLDRMAEAGVRVDDMHPRNIMLGSTRLDPTRRAYLIDGGHVLPVAPGTSTAQLRRELEHQSIMTGGRMIPQQGISYETYQTFRAILDDGLRKSARKGRWQRFWDGLVEAFVTAPWGGAK